MSSASELFYNRRSRASRSVERGLGQGGIPSDRDRHSLRRSFLWRRRNHLSGIDDMHLSRQPRALLRSEQEPPQSIDSSPDESGASSGINNRSAATERSNRLSSSSNAQLSTTVLQARARLLERLRGISMTENRQEEVSSNLVWNYHLDEAEGRNSHDAGRTRGGGGISPTGARPEMGSSNTIILEELATIDAFVDRIRSQLANARDLPQHFMGRSPGLSREAINNLLHEVFGEEERGGTAGAQCDCSVCLESFEEGEELLRLHCGHRFHCACLEPWLSSCADCPYCRARI